MDPMQATGATATLGVVGGSGSRDWLGLPEPAVYLILRGLLLAVADVFSLGGACRRWRSVFTACKRELFSSLCPLLVDRGSFPGAFGGLCCLTERRFYPRKKPIDWLWIRDNSAFCWSPWEIVGLSHGYWIVCADISPNPRQRAIFLVDPLSPEIRILLPEAPQSVGAAVLKAPPISPNSVIIALSMGSIQYCRLRDSEWSCQCFDDDGSDNKGMAFNLRRVAVLGSKVYAMAGNGKLVIMELLPRVSFVVLEVKGLPQKYGRLGQLGESNGEILNIVDECGAKVKVEGTALQRDPPLYDVEHRFVVRRLELPRRRWTTLNNLGGRSLFLNSKATSLAYDAARWGCGGDCIYSFCGYSERLLAFHMKDGSVEHHPLPNEYNMYDWLIPSFVYESQ